MINIADIIYAHKLLIKHTGGMSGLRDRGLLESAVAAPFNSYGGVDFYPAGEKDILEFIAKHETK